MGDQLMIESDATPWMPARGSRLVAEFDRYDVPTMGILEQGGNEFAFWCVEGLMDPLSVWAFTLLEDYEVQALSDSDEYGDDFDRAFFAVVSSKPTTLALRDEQEGRMVLSAPVERVPHTELFDAFRALLRTATQGLPMAEAAPGRLEPPAQ